MSWTVTVNTVWQPSQTITGTAVDTLSNPIVGAVITVGLGAQVSAYNGVGYLIPLTQMTEVLGTVTTDATGAYSITFGLTALPEALQVSAAKPGVSFTPAIIGRSFNGTPAVQAFVGTILYLVSGTVVSTDTPPVPLASATVMGNTTMTADANGAWSEWVLPGTYTYYSEVGGVYSTPVTVTVTNADISGITLVSAAGTTWTGRVVDQTGAALSGATVVLSFYSSTQSPVQTDATGTYLIRQAYAMPPAGGTLSGISITATLSGYIAPATPVAASAGGGVCPTIVMTKQAFRQVSGHALWADTHLPAGDLQVGGSWGAGPYTGSDGFFTLTIGDTAETIQIGSSSLNDYYSWPGGETTVAAGIADITDLIIYIYASAVAPASVQAVDTSGTPIAGVLMLAIPAEITDIGGAAQIPIPWSDMGAGTVAVTPTLAGWTFAPTTAYLASGNFQQFVGTRVTGQYALSGHISGAVLANVRLTVTSGASTWTTYSNVDGSWSLGGLADGTYSIAASLSGYTFNGPLTGVIITGADVTGQDFTATAVTPSSFIIGGAVSGAVQAEVLITLTGTGYRTYTASDGTYVISGLPAGTYYPVASRPGFTFSTVAAQVMTTSNVTGVNFTATAVATSLTISGAVTLSGTGLPGVTFLVNGVPFTTDASGNYAVTGINSGDYVTLTPYAQGYTFTPPSLTLQVYANMSGQDFTAAAALTISGQVVAEGTRGGLPGAQISAGGLLTVTDSQGNFLFSGLLANTTYTLSASLAGYTFSPTSQAEVLGTTSVQNVAFTGTPVGDTTPPVVTILTPLAGATLTTDTPLTWSATDNVGVVSCAVLIDGNTQVTLAGTTSSSYAWTWPLSGWSNGTHTLEVTATDAAGNIGTATITLTVNRSLATETKYLFTKVVSTPGGPNETQFSGQNFGLGILAPAPEVLPADPNEIYNVTAGIYIADQGDVNFGDGSPTALAAAFSKFQAVSPYKSFQPTLTGHSWRAALCAQPQMVLSWWTDTAHVAATRIVPLPSGDLAILATPAAVLKLTTGSGNPALSTWESVVAPVAQAGSISFESLWQEPVFYAAGSVPTVTDACYYSGKLALAAGPYLILKDLGTGILTDAITLPNWAAVDAVTADNSGPAYVAVWDGTTAKLYTYDLPTDAIVYVTDLPARAQTILPWGTGIVLIGTQTGVIVSVSVTAASATTLYDTTQPHVNRLVADGTVPWALTGSAGELYQGLPAWALNNAFGTMTELYGAATFGNALYLGGNSGDLWRLVDQTWSNWKSFAGVTAINDAYAPADGSALYLAVTQTASGVIPAGATVYRLEMSAASGFQTGPTYPDFIVDELRHLVSS